MRKLITKLMDFLDPYRQSFLFFKWNAPAVLLIVIGTVCFTIGWRSGIVKLFLDNVFVYLPNYLTHEMAGHNLVGNIFFRMFYSSVPGLGNWIATLAGNGVETLIPLVTIFFCLRMEGGRWTLPPLLYWLSTTFYGAGVYAQDARACSMPLTSSDMVTNYKPGEICGDWHHILEPLGLLNYDQVFAYTFLTLASLLFMLAIYSAWYYWTHPDFYVAHDTLHPQPLEPTPDWQPPNVYTPQHLVDAGEKRSAGREYSTNGTSGGPGVPRISPHADPDVWHTEDR